MSNDLVGVSPSSITVLGLLMSFLSHIQLDYKPSNMSFLSIGLSSYILLTVNNSIILYYLRISLEVWRDNWNLKKGKKPGKK